MVIAVVAVVVVAVVVVVDGEGKGVPFRRVEGALRPPLTAHHRPDLRERGGKKGARRGEGGEKRVRWWEGGKRRIGDGEERRREGKR